MSQKFTLEERRGIARAFTKAKEALWSGIGKEALHPFQKYICHAIDSTGRWGVNRLEHSYFGMAKSIVQERLGEHYSFERWLHAHGVSNGPRVGTRNSVLMQAHRHAWLDKLIAEFSEERLIYVCKCGCPRIRRDAEVQVNDPSQVSIIDGVSCPECDYDGRYYSQVPVVPDFDLSEDLSAEYVEKHGTEVIL